MLTFIEAVDFSREEKLFAGTAVWLPIRMTFDCVLLEPIEDDFVYTRFEGGIGQFALDTLEHIICG